MKLPKRWPLAGIAAIVIIAAGEYYFFKKSRPLSGIPIFQPTADDATIEAKRDLFPMAENAVVFVGDSSCFMGIVPSEIEPTLQQPVINLGVLSSFTAGGNLAMVEEILEKPTPPKAIVFACLPAMLAVKEEEVRIFDMLGRYLVAHGRTSSVYQPVIEERWSLVARKHRLNRLSPEFGGSFDNFTKKVSEQKGYWVESKNKILKRDKPFDDSPSEFSKKSVLAMARACKAKNVPFIVWQSPSIDFIYSDKMRDETEAWLIDLAKEEAWVTVLRARSPIWPHEKFATENHLKQDHAKQNSRDVAEAIRNANILK